MLPGHVPRQGPALRRRPGRDYKPDDDAVISLAQLRLFVTKAIVDVYNQEVDPQSASGRIDRWCASAELRPPRRVRAHDDLIELVGAYEQRQAERRGLPLVRVALQQPRAREVPGRDSRRPPASRSGTTRRSSATSPSSTTTGGSRSAGRAPADYAEGSPTHHTGDQAARHGREPQGRIRMGALLMAKAELFELGKAMIKARRGRRKLTKVAQFLGWGGRSSRPDGPPPGGQAGK